jgi:hypothetical protein
MAFSSVVGASSVIRPGVCTSTTRPSSPYDGQVIYETDTDLVKAWNGSTWVTVGPSSSGAVVQVKNSFITDYVASSTTTFSDITGMSVSITPTSSSNKILILCYFDTFINATTGRARFNIVRGSTNIFQGSAGGVRTPYQTSVAQYFGNSTANGSTDNKVIIGVDSPATTSATTYKLTAAVDSTAYAVFIAGLWNGATYSTHSSYASITAMEILP